MGVIADLKGLSSAEEFFGYLGVAYEPERLNVVRLHVLRRLQQRLAAEQSSTGEPEEAIRERYRAQLAQAYSDLLQQGPIERRLFKVHQDAVTAKSETKPNFVPLSSLDGNSQDNG